MILQKPDAAWCLYVLAHGAGAGMRHPFLQQLADALAKQGVATLRYEFPYMEEGRARIDGPEILHARVREAIAAGAEHGLPLFAGGKSFGGRVTSHVVAEEPLPGVRGLAFVGFPLHPKGKPAIDRAAHLGRVQVPMLFLQGTRDELARLDLLRPVLADRARATLHVVDDADHSFHVRKKSGRTDAQVIDELAETFAGWAQRTSGESSSRA